MVAKDTFGQSSISDSKTHRVTQAYVLSLSKNIGPGDPPVIIDLPTLGLIINTAIQEAYGIDGPVVSLAIAGRRTVSKLKRD